MGLHAGLGCAPGRLRREQLGQVGVLAAGQAGLEQCGGLAHDHVGALQFRIRTRDRELYALVLADRTVEYHPLVGIVGGGADEPLRVADRLVRDQDALGVHAVEDAAETLAFRPDQVFRRHLEAVEEDLGGVVVDHRTELADFHAVAACVAHVHQQDRDAVGLFLHLVGRGGAHQQEHQVGVLGARGPHFLAMHHIVVALAHRAGFQFGGVGTGGGFGHPEGLQAQFPGRDLRQVSRLLLGRAVAQHRAHGVHLRVGGGGVAAVGMAFLQDHPGRAQGQAGAAVFLGDQRGEIACLGHRLHKLAWVGLAAVEVAPVGGGIVGADAPHAVADFRKILAQGDADALDVGIVAHGWLEMSGGAQRALKAGLRFSLKAATPSRRSSVVTRRL